MKGTLINTPTLETGRLILRKFTEHDLEWLFLILHDKEVNQFLPWYPIDSIEEAKKFYEERYASKYVQPQAYAYAICLKTDDHPIGYIKVDMEEHHDFGYGLRREFWHQGLVTEAGKAVIAQVKKDGLPYITATHDRNNPRSGGVMRNVGMKYQYSYEEQWQPIRLRDLLENGRSSHRLHKSGYGGTSRFRIWASQGILASGTCHRSGQSGDRPSEKGRPALYHSNA